MWTWYIGPHHSGGALNLTTGPATSNSLTMDTNFCHKGAKGLSGQPLLHSPWEFLPSDAAHFEAAA